jgi:CheY-like chemotaxis protein
VADAFNDVIETSRPLMTEAAEVEPAADPPDSKRIPQARLRILVVDANVDAADSVAWLLRHEAHDVRTANDGRSAIEVAASFRPQVVVLDLGLPKLDGYEVSRRLRNLPVTRDALMVAVSGYGQDEDKRQAQEAGFDFHMTKPVDPARLIAVIASAPALVRAPG